MDYRKDKHMKLRAMRLLHTLLACEEATPIKRAQLLRRYGLGEERMEQSMVELCRAGYLVKRAPKRGERIQGYVALVCAERLGKTALMREDPKDRIHRVFVRFV